ncbi:MAG: SDR family NAD(P)-dependent oxidoreductase, partial [Gammaproteobacteria bacterium]|nr:SDR family NAD(P)-dependent oxidoreductase [Gammaproteobacteria bacterium]
TFLITGATDGIGKATALALAERGARVILHGRDPRKLTATLEQLRAATGNGSLQPVLADFSSLAEVAALGQRVRTDFPGLNVLINNAGLLTDHWQQSADGFEMTFAVNYLAPFLLTQSLLDTIRANAPGRVVNVASTALGGGRVDFGNQQLERAFDGWQAYANTKLMNVLFSHHLAGRLAGSGVVSNALCPGLIDTNFFHTNTLFAGGGYERLKPGMRPPAEGALMPLYLATDPAAGEINGTFYVRQGRNGRRAVPLDWDRAAAAELWAQSLAAVGRWLAR